MSGNVLNKVMGFFGFDDDYDEIEEVENEEMDKDYTKPADDNAKNIIGISKKQNKVVNIHTAANAKVVIIRPKDYDEVVNIVDNLKSRRIVIVNTSDLEPKVAQRFLDFMSGASYSLSGELQEIEKGVYILSPSNIEVSSDFKSDISIKGMFNWNK